MSFDTPAGSVYAVNGLDLRLGRGESLAVLGESGCGKSAAARTIVGILDCPPGRIRRGSILYQGHELTTLGSKERRNLMGAEIAWIPQDPLSALNPSFRIGYQLVEAIRVHREIGRRAAADEAVELLRAVGLPNPEERVLNYPHELSGGMRQRVLIAIAIAPEPNLLIADEPTTALDVTIQAEIVVLLKQIQAERGMAIILITHDCALASAFADRVAIMYGGRIIESGCAVDVFSQPAHPYTRGLLQSTPSLAVGSTLVPISGSPPTLLDTPACCSFAPRCAFKIQRCEEDVPPMFEVGPQRLSACFRFEDTLAQPGVLEQLRNGG